MIGLVFCGDLKYCPYIKRYLEILEDQNIEYKVYFWNRSGLDMDLPDNYFYCETELGLDTVGLKKIKGFLDFRRWVVKKLKKDDIDKVIVLSTLSGILIFDELLKRKQDYIFDIRDYSYEHFKPFFLIEKRIIKNSFFTAISSEGFKAFLPEHDYVIAHNFNINDKKGQYYFKRNKEPLKIVWNGVMRFFDYQKQYLDALKNDERFLLVYHGDGPELEKYECYCKENGFNNVIFTGAYNNEDKERLLRDADILNNCYGYVTDAGNKLKYAVSNRFYDGIIYHIPQIVEPSGFKPELVMDSGLGTNMAVSNDFSDKLYEFYLDIDEALFDGICDLALDKILQEDSLYRECISRFVEG